jgi:hypothetical protein
MPEAGVRGLFGFRQAQISSVGYGKFQNNVKPHRWCSQGLCGFSPSWHTRQPKGRDRLGDEEKVRLILGIRKLGQVKHRIVCKNLLHNAGQFWAKAWQVNKVNREAVPVNPSGQAVLD